VGETFDAVVTEVDDKDAARGRITIQDPAVEARVSSGSGLPLGSEVRVRLAQADVSSRSVVFEIV
jgi:hypothetical protein